MAPGEDLLHFLLNFLYLSCLSDQFFDLPQRLHGSLETHPFKGRLAILGHLRLGNQADALEHVGDVVESPDLSFECLFIDFLAIRDGPGCLFQGNDRLPCNEEDNELLAEVPK